MSTTDVSMRTLFEAGVHFGHLARFREPQMSEFIYGTKNKISIINLEKTLPLFKEAMEFVSEVAGRGGKILFVGTKRSASKIIAEAAQKCAMPYVNYRWLGGMLTNYKTIRQSIRRLNTLTKMQEDGTINLLTKKEGLTIRRELIKLENSLGGIKTMGGLPDALFIIDVGHEKIAIQEANRLRIPVIGIVDTNSKPTGVDYMVPGNDDAMRSISLYANTVADIILKAREANKGIASKKFQEEFVEVEEADLIIPEDLPSDSEDSTV
ncbi:MAG TPA: 30S ribosomal protein S2 [Gammaproteobacteria bacterium]|nr:30S ribosomal protein S2 [Gammaproteobacteria bacterium]